MRLLVDIGHPAHVHYFKNLIHRLVLDGWQVQVVARDKECTHALLAAEGIPFFSRGMGRSSPVGKALYLANSAFRFWRRARSFDPDVALSCASMYLAQGCFLAGVPHLSLDDTEHSSLERRLYLPFSARVITPAAYSLALGPKQVRVQTTTEMAYLRPEQFTPDRAIPARYGVDPDQPFVVLRFVSWDAYHDRGHGGLSLDFKQRLVSSLEMHARVLISSENVLPPSLAKYRLEIRPWDVHHFLSFASLFVGESGTMSTESAALGTPAVLLQDLRAGVWDLYSDYGLLRQFGISSTEKALRFCISVLADSHADRLADARQQFLNDHEDLTEALYKLVAARARVDLIRPGVA